MNTRVFEPGPQSLKSCVLPLDQAQRANSKIKIAVLQYEWSAQMKTDKYAYLNIQNLEIENADV